MSALRLHTVSWFAVMIGLLFALGGVMEDDPIGMGFGLLVVGIVVAADRVFDVFTTPVPVLYPGRYVALRYARETLPAGAEGVFLGFDDGGHALVLFDVTATYQQLADRLCADGISPSSIPYTLPMLAPYSLIVPARALEALNVPDHPFPDSGLLIRTTHPYVLLRDGNPIPDIMNGYMQGAASLDVADAVAEVMSRLTQRLIEVLHISSGEIVVAYHGGERLD